MKSIQERSAADPSYLDELRSNQVERLEAAGVSAVVLASLLVAEGADEEEVSGYGLSLASPTPGPSEIIVNTQCRLGTCKTTLTIEIVIKASQSRLCGGQG
jgi:hypothetical protein